MLPKRMFVLFFIIFLSGCGFIHLTPQQEAFLPVNDNPEVVNSEELKRILPNFAVVAEGEYKLVPKGLVKRKHDAPWCFSGVYGGQNGVNNTTAADVLLPLDWGCLELTLISEMDGYAFGVATVLSNGKDGGSFVVNILITESRDILLYNVRTCQWLEPHRVSAISIF